MERPVRDDLKRNYERLENDIASLYELIQSGRRAYFE
jgi:hypothetical protein